MKNTTLQPESNGDNHPHRPKLVWTMAILILIPAITAIGFMAVLMIREINNKSKASYVSDIVKYMSVSSQLIHELQKERGVSSGFLGVSGKKMVSTLNFQRLLTNQKLATLNTYLESIEVERYGQRLAVQLNLFQENITELPAIRNEIDSKSITRNEAIEYFSEVINDIIGTFQEANTTIRDSELSVPFTACISLIMAKEMAGIERAIMTGIVSEDKPVSESDTEGNTFPESEMHRWMRVLKGQDALFSAYRYQASEEILNKFNNMLSSANTKAVDDIRNRIYERHDEGGYELTPSFVFAAATRRIDELRGVEDAQVQEILWETERISSEAISSLITYSALTGISVIGMYTLCFMIARSITRPIITLTNEVRRVADGDLEHEFEIKPKNEIGDLSRSFKRMRRVIKKNRSMREKTEKEIKSLNKFLEQRVTERTAELSKVNEKLLIEIDERKQAEKSLNKQARIAMLGADVGAALTMSDTLRMMLQKCAESLVNHLDATFARIWTLDKEENMLELQASSGIYTHIDGPHSRVPVGSLKIGLIAQEQKPHLTNDVMNDPRISDREWARREGMVAFAGYPLIVEDRLVGVMAMFACQQLTKYTLDALASVSDEIALGIERKRGEEKLEKFGILFNNISDLAYIYDTEGNILFINNIFEKLSGNKPEQFIGKSFAPLFDEENLKKAVDAYTRTLRGESPEYELYFKDTGILCEYKNLPLRDGKGDIIGVLGTARDISYRKRVEEELVKIQKLESIGVLAGGIAHDFNNSLQAILATISVAKLYINPEDEVYDKLTDAEKITMQSSGLSKQLLTFSKGGDPIMKVVSVPELIRDSCKFATSGSNVRYELGLPPDCSCLVEVDKGQINQVINNLLINASHAMPMGGTIKISAVHFNVEKKDLLSLQEGRYVKIAIKDQGTGIAQEHLQKIFDPYFTTKEIGSGLGLATAFSIIKKHDGCITVESEMGVGTIFYIYLPTTKAEIQQEPILDKAKVRSTEEASIMCKGKILLMDDEDVIRLAVTQHLRNLKYEVETSRDGTEAIELYKRAIESGKPFNVIVMDLTIPGGIGGKETIERLLEIDPEVIAIVTSGYANDPIMAEFNKYGFSGILAKPYEMYELDETLQKVIMEKQT